MVRSVSLRARSETGEPVTLIRNDWDNAKIAVVIVDMWDTVQCVSEARRSVQLASRINEVAARLRADGALIVHAPAGCMEYYADTPARERARNAPQVQSPLPVDWQDWDPSREAPLPPALADDTPCSCEPGEACTQGRPPYPWTHQVDVIDIMPPDVVTDDGIELLSLLEQRKIEDVVVMGVHANRCVLGRPYGIRQLVYWRKRPVLCRDLTDSYHRDPRGHSEGNEDIIAHIEKYWCPTLTSGQLVAGNSVPVQNNVGRGPGSA
jgi:nicotinamidase-related amidase